MRNVSIAIVGRPNVGKSTLFNRLTGKRHAIVGGESGITRDRVVDTLELAGKTVTLTDTGGYLNKTSGAIEAAVQEQVQTAIQEAQLILFVVDVTTGITDLDAAVADLLRKSGKPVLTVVNKVDNEQRELEAAEFYKFGLGDLYTIAALSGRGMDPLWDQLAERAAQLPAVQTETFPKIAILGRPNVGKSSLLNTILGVERDIVTEVPGTTRDTVYTQCKFYGQPMMLVDTAGLRKKGKVQDNIEYYANLRTIRAIEGSDVCILLLDAMQGIQRQDLHIFHLIVERKKGVVIAVNKWDLLPKEPGLAESFSAIIKNRAAPFRDLPILYISATTKKRAFQPLKFALEVYQRRRQRINTSTLNKVMQQVFEQRPAPSAEGKHIKIKYVTQLKTTPPVFGFFCNFPQLVAPAYKRYLQNQLRKHFDYTGVPLTLVFKEK